MSNSSRSLLLLGPYRSVGRAGYSPYSTVWRYGCHWILNIINDMLPLVPVSVLALHFSASSVVSHWFHFLSHGFFGAVCWTLKWFSSLHMNSYACQIGVRSADQNQTVLWPNHYSLCFWICSSTDGWWSHYIWIVLLWCSLVKRHTGSVTGISFETPQACSWRF